MNKEFVPYDLNRELYALGCRPERKAFAYYTTPYHPTLNSGVIMYNNPDPLYESELKKTNKNLMYNSAILWQEAFRWFREKHNLHSYIIDSKSYDWYFNIDDMIKDDVISEVLYFKSHEKAELECLKQLIKIVKEK